MTIEKLNPKYQYFAKNIQKLFCQSPKTSYLCNRITPSRHITEKAQPAPVWAYFFKNMKQRVIVYVDGFNFYYGLKDKSHHWRRYYWLDIVGLFERFMRDDQQLVAVKYFSARPLNNRDKYDRQATWFNANNENPKFNLILGRYLEKTIECRRCHFKMKTFEEKESDVRIATQIVSDAKSGLCDIAIVVSADSDMKPAIELAQLSGVKVFVYFPPNHFSNAIAGMPGMNITQMQRYESRFRQSLLPDTVTLAKSGYVLQIPPKWKTYQPSTTP